MANLVPHEWDAYGEPAPLDSGEPEPEFECGHYPKHTRLGPHLTALEEDLDDAEFDVSNMEAALCDAEDAVAEIGRQIKALQPATPPEAQGVRTWWQ